MDLFKYFNFYQRLTKGRIFLFLLLAVVAVLFQMLAVASFVSVLQFQTSKERSIDAAESATEATTIEDEQRKWNILTRSVFWVLKQSRIDLTNDRLVLGLLLTVAGINFFLSSMFLISAHVFVARLQSYIYVRLQQDAVVKSAKSC